MSADCFNIVGPAQAYRAFGLFIVADIVVAVLKNELDVIGFWLVVTGSLNLLVGSVWDLLISRTPEGLDSLATAKTGGEDDKKEGT